MEKWTLFKLVSRACRFHQGIIFGGAVRDSYLHDHDAQLFYTKYGLQADYHEHPTEFIGRFKIPQDIDCIISSENHTRLIHALQEKYYVKLELVSDAEYLDSSVPHGMYSFKRYSILELSGTEIKTIQMDLIVQIEGTSLIFPFKNYDMDVNSLWWTNTAILVNPTSLPTLRHFSGMNKILGDSSINNVILFAKILENITSHTTYCSSTCTSRRIHKMKHRGWNVKYRYETITLSNDVYDGLCVLCQDIIVGDHSTFICGCAHICMMCLCANSEKLTKCTLCKQVVNSEELQNDVRIYQAIHQENYTVI